jgi:hypothetical protein
VAQARGGQHPTFKYDLAGRGDVVLTSLNEGGAWLAFGDDATGLYYIFSDDGTLLGDVEVGGPLKVAVAPGRYEVRKGNRALRVVVAAGDERRIHDEELQPARSEWVGVAKESEPVMPPADWISNQKLAALEYARMRSLRTTGRGLLIAGAAGMVPFFVMIGFGLANELSPSASPALTGALLPQAIEVLLAASALLSTGGALMWKASKTMAALPEMQDGYTPLAVAQQRELERAQRLRNLGAGLLGGGFGSIGLALPLFIGGMTTDGIAERNALFSTGTALATLGGVLASVGGSLWRDGKKQLDEKAPPLRLSLLGAGAALSGSF